MTIKLKSVTTAVAALTVTGLKIKDIDAIPQSIDPRYGVPILFPRPSEFVSNIQIQRDTFGESTSARKTVSYSLNYIFAYQAVGEGRVNILDVELGMLNMTLALWAALMDADSAVGGADIWLEQFPTFGVISDPAGNQFHGTEISIRVQEFYEV